MRHVLLGPPAYAPFARGEMTRLFLNKRAEVLDGAHVVESFLDKLGAMGVHLQGPSLRKHGIGMRMASARSCSWQPSMTFTLLGQRANLCGTNIAYVSSSALGMLASPRQLMHPACTGVTTNLVSCSFRGRIACWDGNGKAGQAVNLQRACFLRASCTRARHAQTRNSSADASYTHGRHITSHEHEVDILSCGTSGELRRSRVRHNL